MQRTFAQHISVFTSLVGYHNICVIFTKLYENLHKKIGIRYALNKKSLLGMCNFDLLFHLFT